MFEKAPPNLGVYFHRETAYYSIEGRKMELLTISSKEGITNERETTPTDPDAKGIFPDAQRDPSKRPFVFESSKKVIFYAARVHPGETPGSHVLNGALDLITNLKNE